MTSLGLAWRRRQASAVSISGSGPGKNKRRTSPTPLVVSATSSGDSDSDSIVPRDGVRRQTPPRTPDGLRPRRALDEIRDELHLPSHVLQQLALYQNVVFIPPASLPARPNAVVMSPKVSNSSFYSRSSPSTMIAESPDLGIAKTAVGAIVGESRPRVGILPSMPRPHELYAIGVLPPRSVWPNQEPVDDKAPYSSEMGDSHPKEEDEDETLGDPQPYQELNDSTDIGPEDQRVMLRSSSPVSTDASSIRGSEASWPRLRDWETQQEHVPFADDRSFSSRVGLVEDVPATYVYNFDPIQVEGEEPNGQHNFVVAADQMTTVSAMSQSTNPNMSHNDSIHSLDSITRDSHASTPDQYQRHTQQVYSEDLLESVLLRRKAQQQRQAKEHLLFGIIQRLQHDMELVQEVESLHGGDEACFARTPTDREGLVVGYSVDQRQRLTGYLDAILNEMDVARTEEFFLSPSQIQGLGDTHHDLREAMTFVRRLVDQAFPREEYQSLPMWKCKSTVREAVLLESIPESPDSTVRGGDTSLFSLPSECSTTPHTSNRSVATTITSKPSPYRGISSPPRGSSNNKACHEGGEIRYTIQVATTILQRITLACNTLLGDKCSAEETILATEAIKRNYLQLVMVPTRALHSVLEAFVVFPLENDILAAGGGAQVEQDDHQPSLARKVSEDEEHQIKPSLPSRLSRSAVAAPSQLQLKFDEQDEEVVSTTANDMFSPTSDDMKSTSVRIENDTTTVNEELRRQVGSTLFKDDSNEREGPEVEESSSPMSNSSDGNYGRILNKLSETGGYHEYMCEMEATVTPKLSW